MMSLLGDGGSRQDDQLLDLPCVPRRHHLSHSRNTKESKAISTLFEMKLAFLFVFPIVLTAFAPSVQRGASKAPRSLPATTNVDDVKEDSSPSSSVWIASVASVATAAFLTFAASPVGAVSGGGLDFANLDITGSPDFANKNLKGKDFTQGACTQLQIGFCPVMSQDWCSSLFEKVLTIK